MDRDNIKTMAEQSKKRLARNYCEAMRDQIMLTACSNSIYSEIFLDVFSDDPTMVDKIHRELYLRTLK